MDLITSNFQFDNELMDWQDTQYGGWNSGYGDQPYARMRFGPVISPTVRLLLISNAVIFIFDVITRKWGLFAILAFSPFYAIKKLYLWQFMTYMFMHAGIFHILINMLFLWMFGSDVERRIGRKSFLTIYLLCGIFGAGLFALSNFSSIISGYPLQLVGASGAVSGIIVAFAMIFPDRKIVFLLALVFPIVLPAKYFVLGLFIIEILSELGRAGGNVAHITHLGGMVFAYLYMKFKYHYSLPFAFSERITWWFKRNVLWRKKLKNRNKYEPPDSDSFISEEIDPILDKISKHGISNLTWREKRMLRKARSKMK